MTSSSPDSRRTGPWLALVLAVTFAVYAPALGNEFTFDDPYYAKAQTPSGPNTLVASIQPISEYFTKPMGYGVHEQSRSFRPLTVLSYAIVHRLSRSPDAAGGFSDPPWTQHLVNVLLHLLATWLTFRLARRFAPAGPALIAAAVFGLHAVRSDAVASIVGRGELLAFVFGSAAAVNAIASLHGSRRSRVARLAATAGLGFLAFCSKENSIGWAAVIPFAVAVVARQESDDHAIGKAMRRAIPVAVALLPAAIAFFALRGAMLAEYAEGFVASYRSNPLFERDFAGRLPTATMLMAYSLWKTVAPFHLASDYGPEVFTLAESFFDVRVLLSAAILIAVIGIALRFGRTHPVPLLAAAVFGTFAFITSNIPVPIETIFAERHAYTYALSLSLLVAGATPMLTALGVVRFAGIVVTIWLLACAGMCVKRSLDWHDDVTLLVADTTGQPRSVLLKLTLASVYRQQERNADAERILREALELNPNEPIGIHQLAVLLRQRNELDEARKLLDRGLESPQLQPTERLVIRTELGRVLERQGDLTAARRTFEAALAEEPRHAAARRRLLVLARSAGDWARVGALVRDGERATPGDATVGMYRGILLHRDGKWRDAIAAFQRSLPRVATGVDEAWGWLGYAESLFQVRQADAAREIARTGLERIQLTPQLRRRFEALRDRK